MRLLPLLLVFAPVATGKCPPMLEGLPSTITHLSKYAHHIDETLDTACGRRNFTSAFWSTMLYGELMVFIATDEVYGDDSNSTSNITAFRPLYESLKDNFKLIKNEQAKTYVDDLLEHQRKYRGFKNITATNLLGEIFALLSFHFSHPLPVDSQIALAQTFKDAFGVVETAEMKRNRIYTAMKAIERVGTLTKNEKIAEFFAKMYLLAKDDMGMGGSAFERFAVWAQNKTSIEIPHEEVIPAVETLYVQYNSLNNTEAKKFVDWMIASTSLGSSKAEFRTKSEIMTEMADQMAKINEYSSACPSKNGGKCFEALSTEAKAAITTTFRELFEYFKNGLNLDHWAFGTTGKPHGSNKPNGSGSF